MAARLGLFEMLILIVLMFAMPFGMLLSGIGKTRNAAARSQSTNNLKQIGIAFHSHNDTVGSLPHNGGHTDPAKLKAINYGWHNPTIKDSGTWATMILPFMEQEPIWRNAVLVHKDSVNVVPEFLMAVKDQQKWAATIKNYNCPGRARIGFKTDTGKDSYPGVMTDYAINVFLNSEPTTYTVRGAARNVVNCFATNGGVPVDGNRRRTIQGISDGSNNTVLVGGKALPPSVGTGKAAKDWDEGIFSPGNYKPDNEKSTLTSTGTGRGHVISDDPGTEDVKQRPARGGVPWMWRDRELTLSDKVKVIPEYAMDWGGPFPEGVLFLWGDGTVRSLKYNLRGTVNFARMLYPSDGAVIVFD
jgi:hypothetical protein